MLRIGLAKAHVQDSAAASFSSRGIPRHIFRITQKRILKLIDLTDTRVFLTEKICHQKNKKEGGDKKWLKKNLIWNSFTIRASK